MPDLTAIETALVIAVPVIAGMAVLRLATSKPSLRAVPGRTALELFVLLVIVTALLSPGGDMVTPTIGGITAAVVCAAVYVVLRRRSAAEPT